MTPPSRPEYRPRSRGLIIAAIAICTRACSPPRPRPCSTRQAMSASTDCDRPANIEPTMKTTIETCISSFLLNRSASLPQIGVEAVEDSSVAVTTQVYWPCVPCRSVMIVGRALETTVEDRNATNIASNIPERASRICRWVICPCCSTGATPVAAAGSDPGAGCSRVLLTGLLCSEEMACCSDPVLLGSGGARIRWCSDPVLLGSGGAGTVAFESSAGGGAHAAAGPRRAGRVEVGHEAAEQVAEGAGVLLVPSRERRQRPCGAEGPGGLEGVRTRRSQAQEAGPPVLRVGPALDEARALERGPLTAGHGDVDTRARRQGAAPLVAVPLERDHQRPAERRQVAVDLRGRARTDVPAGAHQLRNAGGEPVPGLRTDRHGTSPGSFGCLRTATIWVLGCGLQRSSCVSSPTGKNSGLSGRGRAGAQLRSPGPARRPVSTATTDHSAGPVPNRSRQPSRSPPSSARLQRAVLARVVGCGPGH